MPLLRGDRVQDRDVELLGHLIAAPRRGDGLLRLAYRVHELQNICAQSVFNIHVGSDDDGGQGGRDEVGGQTRIRARPSTFCANASAG